MFQKVTDEIARDIAFYFIEWWKQKYEGWPPCRLLNVNEPL